MLNYVSALYHMYIRAQGWCRSADAFIVAVISIHYNTFVAAVANSAGARQGVLKECADLRSSWRNQNDRSCSCCQRDDDYRCNCHRSRFTTIHRLFCAARLSLQRPPRTEPSAVGLYCGVGGGINGEAVQDAVTTTPSAGTWWQTDLGAGPPRILL
jgi:hypothetical protein